MLPVKLNKIFERLMDKRDRITVIDRTKALREIETIQREHDAYRDGVYDALRAMAEVTKDEQGRVP